MSVPTSKDTDSVDPSVATLHNISVVQFLRQDKRPVFILDAQKQSSTSHVPSNANFINPALRQNKSLYDLVAGHDSVDSSVTRPKHEAFLDWIRSSDEDGVATEFRHEGFTWSCSTLASRWKVFVADTASHHCTCTKPESEIKSNPEQPSTSTASVYWMDDHVGNETENSNTRSDSQGTSKTSLSSKSQSRGQNFYAEELRESEFEVESDKEQNAKDIEMDLHSEEEYGSKKIDKSGTSMLDSLSSVRIAKRNADILAKISAFNAMGICIADVKGDVVFANDAWFEICRLPNGPAGAAAWMSIFDEAEVLKVADVWNAVTVKQEVVQFQIPLKWRWNPSASPDINVDSADFPVWISVWAYPDISPDGETLACCTLLTDITAQKWSERLVEEQLAEAVERAKALEQLSRDLAASESRFRRIADSMPNAISMYDVTGKVIYVNHAYLELIPEASDPTLAEPWWSHIAEEELDRAKEAWRKLREERVKVSFEMWFLKSSTSSCGTTPISERKYMTVSAFPELGPDGQVKNITGSVTDVSHLKIAEQVQLTRADNAEASKRQLEQFIDMTSHEIRNPLSAIVHSSEEVLTFLRNYPKEPTAAAIKNVIDTVETIMDCTSHTTRIVDDILIVSKLDSGLLSIAPFPVRIVPAIKQALKMFDGEMRAADISQSLMIDESFETLKLEWVCLDVSRVLQIFVNLITNAIKFTRPEYTRRIHTRLYASLERPTDKQNGSELQYLTPQAGPASSYLSSRANDGKIVYISISVSDSGCGLSEGEQKNLFRRFLQAGSRTHVKYGGTGLGLFISRQLSEMQGGQIGLRSSPGKGSTFEFYVKGLKCDSPGTQETEGNPEGQRIGSRQSKARKLRATTTGPVSVGNSLTDLLSDKTILLVEDHLVNQKVVAKMLRGKGLTVLVANHGIEALDRIRESKLFSGALNTAPSISLILLDIEMPVMDGLTCVRHIRKMEDLGELRGHVPVIATTANARQEQIKQAEAAGMDNVVTKPFRMDQLLDVMTQLWERYSL